MLEVNFSNYNTYSTDCLTQWDTNQALKITGLGLTVAPTILFTNRVSVTTDPVTSTLNDGVVTCDIPNGMLTKSYPITAYIRTTVNGTTTTIGKIKIPVIPSAEPDDYVFIENISIISYETLVSKINSKVDTSVYQAKISALEKTISEILENGTTQDQIDNSVENWITQAIADGTIAAMTIEDGSITQEKLSPDIHLGVKDNEITAPKLSGVTVEVTDTLEYENSYIDYTTGEIESATGLHVTNAYPVVPGNYIYMYDYIYNYNSKANGAYYDVNGALVNTFRNETLNFYYEKVPTGAAYVRFTITDANKDSFHFGNPLKERETVTYTDTELNQTLANMIANLLPERSVDFSALNLFKCVRYNKIDTSKKSDITFSVRKGSSELNGTYHCDIEPGKSYKTDTDLVSDMRFLVFLDTNGEIIDRTSSGENVFKSYSSEVVNYHTYYTFEIPDDTAEVVYVHSVSPNITSIPVIAETAEFDTDKDPDTKTWVCTSKEFAEAIAISNVEKTYPELEGKVWIALGDSYTVYAASCFKKLATEFGMTIDNRGKVSSTICGDETGAKGFDPFWSRMNSFIQEYTEAGTAENVKLITFMGGANDGFGGSTWLGTGRTSLDKNTIYGSLNYMFNKLKQTFVNAEIVVILQPSNYAYTVSSITSDEDAQKVGFADLAELQQFDDYQYSQYAMTRKEMVVKEMAEMYGLHIVDCIFNWYSPVNPTERATYWDTDKIHLSAAGSVALTAKLKDKLVEIFD